MPRTPEELGAIVRERRLALGRKQVDVLRVIRAAPGERTISEPTYRAVETGRTRATDLSLAAVSVGLDWPPNALRAIRDGADPADVEHVVPAQPPSPAPPGPTSTAVAASGATASGDDLEELRLLDPEAYEQLMSLARLALDRARARARGSQP